MPHYFIVREIYQADCLEEAIRAVRRAHRAIPANLILATPQGPANLEITLDDVHVLLDNGDDILTHTNHCVHPDLLSINDEFPELAQSGPRKIRVDALFEESDRPLALERMMDVLRDHDNYPGSICRHSGDDPVSGFWTSVFSVVIDVDDCLMYVSRGNPCQQPYEQYKLYEQYRLN